MKETLPGLGVDPPAAVEGVELLAPPADGVDLSGERLLVLPARLGVAVAGPARRRRAG